MDVEPPSDLRGRRDLLPAILGAIRRRRGLRSSEVARAMGLPLRTYQRFESGTGELDLDRIHQFADVTNSDGWAIVLALDMGFAEFALHCLDNKAATVCLHALQRFNLKAGPDIARLDPRSIILAFERAFDALARKARDDDAFVESWMTDPELGGGHDDDP